MAILAAGVGFAVRGGIFANWGADFGFTGAELGDIGGAGFTGFCFGIIIGGVIVDRVGYGTLVVLAFLLHAVSAFVTFGARTGLPKETVYNYLYWGMFIFAYANGTLEAVANPLVATLYPENRTHYLNILHASWPAGLVLGGLIGAVLGAQDVSWKVQLGLYLVPVAIYGLMFFGQSFPKSEASEKGLSTGEMFKDVGILGGAVVCVLLGMFFEGLFGNLLPLIAPSIAAYSTYLAWGLAGVLLLIVGLITGFSIGAVLLFVLFFTHALVGAVELGTDGWMQNITGIILTPTQGKILFVFTSAVMFSLRFCAHFIEKNLKLSPVGILFVCAVLACIGINLVAHVNTFPLAMAALFVYALGKTFFWPTMLAVASDRFPRTGAIAISIMGGIGMMSAGLIGSKGLGYFKDRYAGEALNASSPALYAQYQAKDESKFMPQIFAPVHGLDGTMVGAINKKVETKAAELDKAGKTDDPKAVLSDDEKKVLLADIEGARGTLKVDSYIPAAMAVIYLLMLLYFKSIGGYKAVHIDAPDSDATQ